MARTESRLDGIETHMGNMGATMKSLETQIGQLANALRDQNKGQFPSNTEVNSKEQCKAVTLRSGRELEVQSSKERMDKEKTVEKEETEGSKAEVEVEQPPVFKPILPYPQRFKKKKLDDQFAKILEIFKKIHINIPFADALEQMPNYAKFIKDVISKKRKLQDFETVKLTEECSAILQKKLLQKLKDPGSFTIPCIIGCTQVNKALCDLGASINLLPFSTYRDLKLGEVKPTTITLQLADRSLTYPRGIVEDVLVKVDKFIFPADFVILDMEEDQDAPLIFGRPFLATGKALIDVHKGELTLRIGGEAVIFNIYKAIKGNDEEEEEFVFSDILEHPVPSILRGYSAPVRMDSNLTDADLSFLLANDSDEFNRWEAGQVLARKLMFSLVSDFQLNKPLVLSPRFLHGIQSVLGDSSMDKEFIAKAITLPGEGEIMDMMEVADPDAVHAVRTFIRKQIATELKEELLNAVKNNRSSEQYEFNHLDMARRALKNIALAYLGSLGDAEITELALEEYKTATNMTEQFGALAALEQTPGQMRDDVLADFYNKWQHDFLVVSKWFALQAMSDVPGNVENVRNLINHPAFDIRNPNKVYSLIGGFRGSPVNFHAKDGSGYKFLGEMVVKLDRLNPQMASRMVSTFSRWKRYDENRQVLAKAQPEMILSANGLSENVFEIASKSLAS